LTGRGAPEIGACGATGAGINDGVEAASNDTALTAPFLGVTVSMEAGH